MNSIPDQEQMKIMNLMLSLLNCKLKAERQMLFIEKIEVAQKQKTAQGNPHHHGILSLAQQHKGDKVKMTTIYIINCIMNSYLLERSLLLNKGHSMNRYEPKREPAAKGNLVMTI
jgi:hypothetical protein